MFRKVVGVKVGVVSVGAPPLLLLLVIPGLLPLVLAPLVDGKMSRLDLGVPGVLRSTTGVYQGGMCDGSGFVNFSQDEQTFKFTCRSPLDWFKARSVGPGRAPPPASSPSLRFSLATI